MTVWTQNPPEYGEAGRDKYLVVMVDYSGPSEHSFNRICNEWRNVDLNGERKGALRGEWVIRIALHRHNAQQRKAITALGPARYRKAVVDKEDFVWDSPMRCIVYSQIGPTPGTWETPGRSTAVHASPIQSKSSSESTDASRKPDAGTTAPMGADWFRPDPRKGIVFSGY